MKNFKKSRSLSHGIVNSFKLLRWEIELEETERTLFLIVNDFKKEKELKSKERSLNSLLSVPKVKCFRLKQSLKAFFVISIEGFSNVRVSRFLQPEKTESPKEITDSGIMKDDKLEQPENA